MSVIQEQVTPTKGRRNIILESPKQINTSTQNTNNSVISSTSITPNNKSTVKDLFSSFFSTTSTKTNPTSPKRKIIYDDGTVFVGQTLNSLKHGQGTITNPQGDIYIGEFKYDFICGKGKLSKNDGSTYKGSFLKGKSHGKGKETWSNASYEGYYKNGLKHGKGKYTWENGSSYFGEWRKGKMNGYVG